MRRLMLSACLLLPLAAPSLAAGHAKVAGNDKLQRSLQKLDPSELVTQVCDLGAMQAFAKDASWRTTDRVLIDAISTPRITGNKAAGDGGALRRGNDWYRFSFSCTLSADHMKVTDFRYKVGAAIPKSKWADIGLWN
ncbi:DUF930 domain-containing protein [Ancylobacter sp. 6x-1]|uniref:DUF930 domain-containing protein n=1 Tax=Ancylobacter crimeensis TaxID=2579147 RepID=A0ABT0D8A4_9HYPH|nr:DUF930 domain-containing protein [Ancylobacter crimeensis]MCK0196175.1 DUF930 domain-containing protein [Ancylobacter crimeensis]